MASTFSRFKCEKAKRAESSFIQPQKKKNKRSEPKVKVKKKKEEVLTSQALGRVVLLLLPAAFGRTEHRKRRKSERARGGEGERERGREMGGQRRPDQYPVQYIASLAIEYRSGSNKGTHVERYA